MSIIIKIKDKIQIKKIKENLKNFKITYNLIATLIILVIVILRPCITLFYTRTPDVQLGLLYWTIIIGLGLLLCVKFFKIIKGLIKNKGNFKFKLNRIKIDLVDISLLLYIILIAISTFTSPFFLKDQITSTSNIPLFGCNGRFEGSIMLLVYIVLFYIAYKFFKFKPVYLVVLAISTIFLSVCGLLQALDPSFHTLFHNKYATYAYASFGNPNFFSSYLCIVLPIFMAIYLKRGNLFYLITSIITFGALVCTKTLSGYVTFIIFTLVLIVYSLIKRFGIKRLLLMFAGFAIIFLSVNTTNKNIYLEEFFSLFGTQGLSLTNTDSFASDRGAIYKLVIKIIGEHPYFGVGPDCLGKEVVKNHFYASGYDRPIFIDKAHCEYLQIAVCTGIFSLACYLTFILTIAISLLVRFFKNTDNFPIFVVGLSIMAYLIQATVNISITRVAPIFWIMLGIGYSFCKQAKTENKNKLE